MEKPKSGQLILLQKMYDLVKFGYQTVKQFPKAEKFSMGAAIKESLNLMLGYTVAASEKSNPKSDLQKLDIENKKMRAFVKMAMEFSFISMEKYEQWSSKSVEIGKLLGGWLRSLNGDPNK